MLSVFLVEDDERIRRQLAAALSNPGHGVHAVGTAVDALRDVDERDVVELLDAAADHDLVKPFSAAGCRPRWVRRDTWQQADPAPSEPRSRQSQGRGLA